MANEQYQIRLAFTADSSQVQNQINTLRQSLLTIQTNANNPQMFGGMVSQMKVAVQTANQLQTHLNLAMNAKTGQLDLSRFNMSLKTANQDLSQLSMSLLQSGTIGQQSFMQMANSILYAQKPIKQTNTLLLKMYTTLMNTARWQISSTLLMGFISSVREAYNYVKDLNTALTDIRIVTGYTKEEIDKLAISANKMARELKKSTLDVVKGQLIYQQQGDSMALSAKKAEITIKATATATKASAEEMSNYLTAVWNSYKVGEEQLESFVDKANALGAKTAASQEEIFTAMEKSAAAANAVNVSYDQLGATIATISAVTRNSAETIGTTLKTVYARIGDLKIEGADEDGIGLGQVSGGLQRLGIEILDTQGELRDMGTVIEEIGDKYQYWTEAQQAAAVQLIAGKRQYTQMMALFENWDMYKLNLDISLGADGELEEQFGARQESIEAALKGLSASTEKIFSDIFNDEIIITFVNELTKIVDVLGTLMDSFGGFGNIILMVSSLLINKFSFSISQSFATLKQNLHLASGDAVKSATEIKSVFSQLSQASGFKYLNEDAKTYIQTLSIIAEKQNEYLVNEKLLTNEQKLQYQNEMAVLEILKQQSEMAMVENQNIRQRVSANATPGQMATFDDNVTEATRLLYQQDIADNLMGGGNVNVNDLANIQDIGNGSNPRVLTGSGNIPLSEAIANATQFKTEISNITSELGLSDAKIEDLVQDLYVAPNYAKELKLKLQEAGVSMDKLDKETIESLMNLKKLAPNAQSLGNALQGNAESRREFMRYDINQSNLPYTAEDVNMSAENSRNIDRNNKASEDLRGRGKFKPKPDASTAWMQLGSAISMAASSILMFGNMYDTIISKDTSWGEKLTSIIMTLGMVIPTVTMAMTAFNKTNIEAARQGVILIGQSAGKAVAYLAETGAVTALIGAEKAKQLADWATAASGWAAVGPVILMVATIAALVAIVAIVVIAIKELVNWYNKEAIAAEKAAEKEKALADQVIKVKESYEELKKSFSDYSTMQDALDVMTEGTQEWKDKLSEANQQVLDLMKKYPRLAQYVTRTNQRLIISKEGQQTLLAEQENAVIVAEMNAISASRQRILAEQEAEQVKIARNDNATWIDWLNAFGGAIVASAGLAATVGTGGALTPVTAGIIATAAGLSVGGFNKLSAPNLTKEDVSTFEKLIQEQGAGILGDKEKLKELLSKEGLDDIHIESIINDKQGLFSNFAKQIEENSQQLRILNGQYSQQILQNKKEYQQASDLDKAAMEAASAKYLSGEQKIIIDGQEYTRESYKNKLDESWKNDAKDNSKENQDRIKEYLKQVDPTGEYDIRDTGGGNFTIVKKIDGKWTTVNANLEADEGAKNKIDYSEFLSDVVNEFFADLAILNNENLEAASEKEKRRAQKEYQKVFKNISGINAEAMQAAFLRNGGIFTFDGQLTAAQYDAVYENILQMEDGKEKTQYLNALKKTTLKIDELGKSSEAASEEALKASKAFLKMTEDFSEEIFKEGRASFNTVEELRDTLNENGFQKTDEYINKIYEANLKGRDALIKTRDDMLAEMINEQIAEGFFNSLPDGEIIAYLESLGLASEAVTSLYSKIKVLTKDLDAILEESQIKQFVDQFNMEEMSFSEFQTGMSQITEAYGLNQVELYRIYQKLRLLNAAPGLKYDELQTAISTGNYNEVFGLLEDVALEDWRQGAQIWDSKQNKFINLGQAGALKDTDLTRILKEYGISAEKRKNGQWYLGANPSTWETLTYIASILSQTDYLSTLSGYKKIDSEDIKLKAEQELQEELEELLDEQRLEKLEEVIEKISKIIDKIKKDIDLIDWGLDNADPKDYALQLDLYNQKIIKSGQYIEALRQEYSRLKIEFDQAKTEEEAQTIVDRMEEISGEIQDSLFMGVEAFNAAVQMEFQSIADGFGEISTIANATVEYLQGINNIQEDMYKYGSGSVLRSQRQSSVYFKNLLALMKTDVGDSEAVKAKKKESQELIKEEEKRNNEIYDIRMKALDKLHADAEKKRQEDLADIQKNNAAIVASTKQTGKELADEYAKWPSPQKNQTGSTFIEDISEHSSGFDKGNILLSTYTPNNGAIYKDTYLSLDEYLEKNPDKAHYFQGASAEQAAFMLYALQTSQDNFQPYGEYKEGGRHTGIDFNSVHGNKNWNGWNNNKLDTNQIVISFTSGIVTGVSNKSGYGNTVVIQDQNGYFHYYSHLPDGGFDELKDYKGKHISAGSIIAFAAGSTGNSTGPHVHYEVRDPNNKVQNPTRYLGLSEDFIEKYTSDISAYSEGGPASGLGIVGENGRELVMWKDPGTGQYHFAVVEKMALANFPEGSVVFDNEKTEHLLNNPVDLKKEFELDNTTGEIKPEFQLAQGVRDIITKAETDPEGAAFDFETTATALGTNIKYDAALNNLDSFGQATRADISGAKTVMKDINKDIIAKSIEFGDDRQGFAHATAEYLKDGGVANQRYEEQYDILENRKQEILTQLQNPKLIVGSEQYNNLIDILENVDKEQENIAKSWTQMKEAAYELAIGQIDANIKLADSTETVKKNLGTDNIKETLIANNEVITELHKKTELAAETWGTDSQMYREALEEETAKIRKQKEAYVELAEQLKDFSISKIEGQKNNLSQVNEITKSIRQEQHNLNKELQASLTSYQYLDAETRKLLLNEEDYLKLNQKLNNIQKETDRLSAEYLKKLEEETDPEKLEILNNEYQRKYELQMKSYEIAKQELEVEKKKTALINTLNERNVQMFINGEWTWVADTDAVIQAQNDLTDAQYGLDEAQFDLSDTKAMQKLDAEIDKINGAFDDLKEIILGKDGVEEALDLMGKKAYDVYEEFSRILSDEKSGERTVFDNSQGRDDLAGYDFYQSYSSKKEASEPISANTNDYVPISVGKDGSGTIWVKKSANTTPGYATGTPSAKSGLARVIEQGSELLATKEGFLYEMSGGEMVFNNDQFRFLYELSKTPVNKMLSGLTHNDNSSIDNSITINGISIDSNSQEGEALKDILTRVLGNR